MTTGPTFAGHRGGQRWPGTDIYPIRPGETTPVKDKRRGWVGGIAETRYGPASGGSLDQPARA